MSNEQNNIAILRVLFGEDNIGWKDGDINIIISEMVVPKNILETKGKAFLAMLGIVYGLMGLKATEKSREIGDKILALLETPDTEEAGAEGK